MRPNLKTVCLLLAVVAFLPGAFREATGKPEEMPEDRGKLVLKVWTLPNPRDTSPPVVAELAVIERFQEKYPNISLRSFTGISIAGMGMDSQILMAIAGGMAPDVMTVNFRQSETYISQGFLRPMDEFVETLTQEQIHERVPGPVFPVAQREGPDGKLHWYMIPYSISVRALMYRKDLFQEVGLDPNKPPRTWKQMEEYAERLTRPDKGTYGLSLTLGPYASWDWMTFLWSAGGDSVAQNEKGEWEAVFDSDEAVEATRFYVKLMTHPWLDASGKQQRGYCYREAQSWQKWNEGKIGMTWANLREMSIGGDINPDVVALAAVPEGPAGRATELNAGMKGIFSDIKPRGGYSVEEIRQAAFDYIWFYGSEEANRIRTRILVERGYGKFLNPEWLRKYGYEEYLKMVPEEWIRIYEDAMANGRPEPYGKNCQLVYNFMSKPLDKCVQEAFADKLGDTEEDKRKNIKKILHEAVERTNVEMIGVISPRERRKRNSIALVVGLCMIVTFIFLFRKVWLIFTPKEEVGISQKGGWQFWKYRWAYVILVPAVGTVLLWRYFPMAWGTIMAFQDYRVVGDSKFIGLENLADVLWDSVWWASLGRTLYYMALMLGLGFWTPIVLAVLLSEVSHGKVVYRTLYYLPAVLTGMVVIYLWKMLYDPSDSGILNMLLAKVGVDKLLWLESKKLAMICCVIPTVWAGMGPGCLIYLAALKSVPDDLYEAADIDGCGFFKKFWYITVPTIKGLIIIQFIGAFIGASQSTGFILVMTYGGPDDATRVAGLHIFENAYIMLRFGTAVTMAWLLGVTMMGFTTLQLKRLSRMEFRTADSAKKSM